MLTARMTEYESQLASAVAKTTALEKMKNQLQLDAESLVMQLDKVGISRAREKRNAFLFVFKNLLFEFRATNITAQLKTCLVFKYVHIFIVHSCEQSYMCRKQFLRNKYVKTKENSVSHYDKLRFVHSQNFVIRIKLY